MPGIGEVWAREVAERFRDLPSLMATAPASIDSALQQIHGFGEERARAVSQFFAEPRNRAVLEKLIARGVSPVEPQKAARSGPLAGLRFCVTGTLTRPRGDIQAAIEAAGGVFDKSVKKGTTYLVTGADVGATKIKDAEKKGTKVIDEAALDKLLRGENL
jgi:DNA ligase (NAD+)